MLGSSLFSQPVGRLGEGMVLGLEGWDSDTVTYNIYQFKMYNETILHKNAVIVTYHSQCMIFIEQYHIIS